MVSSALLDKAFVSSCFHVSRRHFLIILFFIARCLNLAWPKLSSKCFVGPWGRRIRFVMLLPSISFYSLQGVASSLLVCLCFSINLTFELSGAFTRPLQRLVSI